MLVAAAAAASGQHNNNDNNHHYNRPAMMIQREGVRKGKKEEIPRQLRKEGVGNYAFGRSRTHAGPTHKKPITVAHCG